jgi:hypothetical protein
VRIVNCEEALGRYYQFQGKTCGSTREAGRGDLYTPQTGSGIAYRC